MSCTIWKHGALERETILYCLCYDGIYRIYRYTTRCCLNVFCVKNRICLWDKTYKLMMPFKGAERFKNHLWRSMRASGVITINWNIRPTRRNWWMVLFKFFFKKLDTDNLTLTSRFNFSFNFSYRFKKNNNNSTKFQ